MNELHDGMREILDTRKRFGNPTEYLVYSLAGHNNLH
jgi:hypothetical protein